MKRLYILAATWFFLFLVAVGYVFHIAAKETAKRETLAYGETNAIYNLAYYSYLRHGLNRYLSPWLVGNEEVFPLSWLKDKHHDIYKSFLSDSKGESKHIYADFLFYIKPCNKCLVNDNERVQKGILILKELANASPENFIPPSYGFIVAAETYNFVHLNAKNYTFTRKEYYNALTDSWQAHKKFSPFLSQENENPYEFWLSLEFYFNLLKRIGYVLDSEGVVNVGCSSPLITTFQEMHGKLPLYSQLALNDFQKKNELPLNLTREQAFNSSKGDKINYKINNYCLLSN